MSMASLARPSVSLLKERMSGVCLWHRIQGSIFSASLLDQTMEELYFPTNELFGSLGCSSAVSLPRFTGGTGPSSLGYIPDAQVH